MSYYLVTKEVICAINIFMYANDLAQKREKNVKLRRFSNGGSYESQKYDR